MMVRTLSNLLGKRQAVGRNFSIAAAVVLSGLAFSAQANMVTNGSFDDAGFTAGYLASGTANLPGWTIGQGAGNGYSFLALPGSAGTNFASPTNGPFGGLSFWDSNTNGGLDPIPATSPQGGSFFISDGAFQNTTLYQTVTGLEVGEDYQLSFFQAAAQQFGFNGDTLEQWQVSFGGAVSTTTSITLPDNSIYTPPTEVVSGGDIQLSDLMTNPSRGFQDWHSQTMTFTATATSELLGFLALGSPLGQPPFLLLDGVSLTKVQSVPEPTTLFLMIFGGGMLFSVIRTRPQFKKAYAKQ